MRLEFHINKVPGFGVHIWLIKTEGPNNQRSIAKPVEIEWEKYEEKFETPKPFLQFGYFEAPQIMPALVDALARAGYRAENSDAGELKATKVHLADMQKLVFERDL